MGRDAPSSTKVNIFGEELGIRSEVSPEYTRRVADYVDQAMKQVARVTKISDVHKIAILAAMSITNEFFQVREKAGQIDEEHRRRLEGMLRSLQEGCDLGD